MSAGGRSWLAALALGVAVAASGEARAQAADPDPWLGRDKALHFGLSAGIAGVGYGLGALWQPSSELQRLVIGGSAALGVGVVKEVFDLATGQGTASWKDLAWGVAGTAVGLAVAWAVDRFVVQPLWRAWGGAGERTAEGGRGVAGGTKVAQSCTGWNRPISLCW